MTDQRFKIVFSGELMPDASLETVKDNRVFGKSC